MIELDAKTQELVISMPAGSQPARISMAEIYRAKTRLRDVAIVTPHKAPELLATFNEAYLNAAEASIKMRAVLLEAQKVANRRKAIVLLDIVPQVLREKGLFSARSPGGSEDQREAVLAQDAEYEELMDRVHAIEAAIQLIIEQKKGFENAYTSVKKILGGEVQPGGGINRNRNLSAGGEPEGLEPGMQIRRTHPAFGNAKI